MSDSKCMSSFLTISSTDDPNANSVFHNPADFTMSVPNSTKLNGVTRVCYNSVSIPRMFNIITPLNNALYWWQRAVIWRPFPGPPNTWYLSVDFNWTLRQTILLPVGMPSITDIVNYINANTIYGTHETWSYDATNRQIVIKKDNPDPVIPFGTTTVSVGPPPPYAVPYANMTYLTAFLVPPAKASTGFTGSFDPLGLITSTDQALLAPDTTPFDPTLPNSFASTLGSNIAGIPFLPLFQKQFPSYNTWATTSWHSNDPGNPKLGPPNLNGPTVIYVVVNDIGDHSHIDGGTGTGYDAICTVNMTSAQFGTEAVKEVKDVEAEAIKLQGSRNITGLRIRLFDRFWNLLTLPRNYPVNIVLHLLYDPQ